MANPQFYEASRLSGFNDAAGLALFASNRARHGCACNMPVQEMTKDGMLFLLPGNSNPLEKSAQNMTFMGFQSHVNSEHSVIR